MLLSDQKISNKNKIFLLALSFLASLLLQLLIFDADYTLLSSFNQPRRAVVRETNQYEIEGNLYTATGNQAQIFLDTESLPINGLHITFEKALNYHLLFQIYYISAGETASVLKSVEGTCFATERDVFVSLPLGVYEEIRLDFNNNLDSSFSLGDIFFLEESPTMIETAVAKLSFVPTILLLGFFFCLFAFMQTEEGKLFLPFFFVGIITAYYFSLQELFSDDTYYYILQKELQPLHTYTIDNYFNWSSRQIIEAILYYMVHWKTLWSLISGGLSALLCWSISKLLKSTSLQINWFIAQMFFLYPFYHQSTAGWIATTTNYLWPFSFAMLALQTIKKSVNDEEVSKKFLIFQCVITLYAGNMEQLAALLCGFYAVFVLYFKYIKKSAKKLYPQLTISILSLIYHINSPGNAVRRSFDIERYNIDFYEFSLLEKLEMNYTYTLFSFFSKDSNIFFAFCAVVIVFSFYQKKIASLCFISVPLFISSVFHYFLQNNLPNSSTQITSFLNNTFTDVGTGILFNTPTTWIPILVVTFAFISILLSLYFLFEDKKISFFLIIIILAGLASRLILFSSVTMNRLSAVRTYMFLYFAFLVVAVFIYEKLCKVIEKKYMLPFNGTITVFTAIELIMLFIKVNATS